MQRLRNPTVSFAFELLLLALAAPVLYFPGRFPNWIIFGSLGLLATGWLWRRLALGLWIVRTPVDWPVFLFFLVLLPVAVWVPNENLRTLYSLPRAAIMLWCFCLFWVVTVYSAQWPRHQSILLVLFFAASVLIAIAALFGTSWVGKFPLLSPILDRLPPVLAGRFGSDESGFSPNQVAGTLLYSLPLLLALLIAEWSTRRRAIVLVCGSLGALIVGFVLVATQSRSGLAGFGVSVLVLALGPTYWGRRVLLAMALAVPLALLLLPVNDWLLRLDAATRTDIVNSSINVAGRYEIWQRAILGIYSFPLTGMGLGTFREVGRALFPLATIPPSYDIAHAHNWFLQTALDFGIPGLICILSIYLAAIVRSVKLFSAQPNLGSHWWSLGLLAVLAGQTVYSLADAVAMGAKTHFFFWYFLALLFSITQAHHLPTKHY